MSRLIYADALKDSIEVHFADGIHVYDTFAELIDEQPTIEERKKGKWEITNLGAVGVFDSCSECKRVVKHKAPFYNFCPNCGASMTDKREGEKNRN